MKLQALVLAMGIAVLSIGISGAAQFQGKSQAEELFARAKPDDYMGSGACAACHEEKASKFPASPHVALVSDPNLPLDKQGCKWAALMWLDARTNKK